MVDFASRAGCAASSPPAASPRPCSCRPVHPTTANIMTTIAARIAIALLAITFSEVCAAQSTGARRARPRRPAAPGSLTDIRAAPMVLRIPLRGKGGAVLRRPPSHSTFTPGL